MIVEIKKSRKKQKNLHLKPKSGLHKKKCGIIQISDHLPGVGVMVYTILFSRLGIPAEGLVFTSAVEVVSDFGNTGFSVFCQLCIIAYMAKSEGKVVQGVAEND